MSLYRATFTLHDKVRGFTFGHRSLAMASDFAYTVLQSYAFALGGSFIHNVERVNNETRFRDRKGNKGRSAV